MSFVNGRERRSFKLRKERSTVMPSRKVARILCNFCEAVIQTPYVVHERKCFCDDHCVKLYVNAANAPKVPKKSTLYFEKAEPHVDPESPNGERAHLDTFDLDRMKLGRRGESRKWSSDS